MAVAAVPLMMPNSVVSTVQLIWLMISFRKMKNEKPAMSRSSEKSNFPNRMRMCSFLKQYQMLTMSENAVRISVTSTSAIEPYPISSSGSITIGLSTVRIMLTSR